MIVEGKRNPLVEADRKLEAIIEGLPDLGSDTPHKQDVIDDFLSYYRSHDDPNKLGVSDQRRLLKLSGGNPDDARDDPR